MRSARFSLPQVTDGDVEERVDNPDSTVYLIFMEAAMGSKVFREIAGVRRCYHWNCCRITKVIERTEARIVSSKTSVQQGWEPTQGSVQWLGLGGGLGDPNNQFRTVGFHNQQPSILIRGCSGHAPNLPPMRLHSHHEVSTVGLYEAL